MNTEHYLLKDMLFYLLKLKDNYSIITLQEVVHYYNYY